VLPATVNAIRESLGT